MSYAGRQLAPFSCLLSFSQRSSKSLSKAVLPTGFLGTAISLDCAAICLLLWLLLLRIRRRTGRRRRRSGNVSSSRPSIRLERPRLNSQPQYSTTLKPQKSFQIQMHTFIVRCFLSLSLCLALALSWVRMRAVICFKRFNKEKPNSLFSLSTFFFLSPFLSSSPYSSSSSLVSSLGLSPTPVPRFHSLRKTLEFFLHNRT